MDMLISALSSSISSAWTMPSLGVRLGAGGALSPTTYNNTVNPFSGKPLVQNDALLDTVVDRLTLTGAGAGGASQPSATTGSSSINQVPENSASTVAQAGPNAVSSYQLAGEQLRAWTESTLLENSASASVPAAMNPPSAEGTFSSAQGGSEAAAGYRLAEVRNQASEVSTLLGTFQSMTGISSNGMSDLLSAAVAGNAKAAVYGSLIQANTPARFVNLYA